MIKFIGAMRLGITLNYRVFGTEEDMVNAIVSNPSLVEDGLQIIAREYLSVRGCEEPPGWDFHGDDFPGTSPDTP